MQSPSRLAVVMALAVASGIADTSSSVTAVQQVTPISVTPDQNWDGIDGQWSTFTLQVGNPPQFVRTMVSFTSYQTLVILQQGCQAAGDFNDCAFSRGGIFYPNESSTFHSIGTYDISVANNLDMYSNANYGYEQVTLGGLGEGGPSLSNTTVGGMALLTFYTGIFGINPKPTNFTSFLDGSPSYMTQLKEQFLIPSVSAGYTAGAKYRFDGVLASLTLGGYDQSRFIQNDVEFVLGMDNDRDLAVALQSITTPSNVSSSPLATLLLPDPIYASIDSTVSHIWLPIEACKAFEVEFGLIYDNATDLYLVNRTLHSALKQRNANITFTLAQGLQGGPSVDIVLPYAAFDLTAESPFQNLANSTYYFPLRRAMNDTQYTLGRTFLQEAYLSVNWEAQRFNVSQVAWAQNLPKNTVAMPPGLTLEVTNDNSTSTSNPRKLSAGAIAGIAIGAVLGVILLSCCALLYIKRRRPVTKSNTTAGEKCDPSITQQAYVKAELEGSCPNDISNPFVEGIYHSPDGSQSPQSPSAESVGGSGIVRSPVTPFGEGTYLSSSSDDQNGSFSPVSEADSRERHIYEMPGDMPIVTEKDSKTLSEKEAHAHRERIYNGVGTAPSGSSGPLQEETTVPRPPRRASLDPRQVALVRPNRARSAVAEGSTTQSSDSTEPVSPNKSDEASSSMQGVEPTLQRSPRGRTHRAFSFEEPTSPLTD